jgi:hypothetical protein
VALLTIPGALDRTRIFDVDVQLLARVPDQARAGCDQTRGYGGAEPECGRSAGRLIRGLCS